MQTRMEDETIEAIEWELESQEPAPLPGARLTCLVRHELWRGAPLLLDHLIELHRGGERLFLLDRPFGQLNEATDHDFTAARSDFLATYVEPRAGDVQRFKDECLWRIEQTNQTRDELIAYSNAHQVLPPGKVPPEHYALYTFEDARFFGVVDPRTREIFKRRAREKGGVASAVHQIQELHLKMAFKNTLEILRRERADHAVAIVLEPWLGYYQRQSEARKMQIELRDCDAHALPALVGSGRSLFNSLAPKAVIPWTDYDRLLDHLGQRWGQSDAAEPSRRLLGLLFARPASKLARDEILPHLGWWHERTASFFDLFLAGYAKLEPGASTGLPVVDAVDGSRWTWSPRLFNSLLAEVERRTAWEYSGAVDLLLVDAVQGAGRRPELDFSTAIVCQLDAMVEKKAIESVEEFFESIFRHAQRSPEGGAWELSDKLGVEKGQSVIKRFILSLLPKKTGEDVEALSALAVRDIARKRSGS